MKIIIKKNNKMKNKNNNNKKKIYFSKKINPYLTMNLLNAVSKEMVLLKLMLLILTKDW